MQVYYNKKTGKYWDGKGFNAEIQEQALPCPLTDEKQFLKRLPAGMEIEIRDYVSSANLKEEAKKDLEVTHAKKIDHLADEVIHALAGAGEKYLKLCTYIRDNEVAPKLVSFQLAAKGFSRSTISKINTVANLPEAAWNKYAARELGFNKVLALGSGSVQEAIADASGEKVIDVQAEVKALEAEAPSESGDGEPVQPEAVDWEKKFSNSAAGVLRAAAALQVTRSRTVKGGNGYVLVIKKVSKK